MTDVLGGALMGICAPGWCPYSTGRATGLTGLQQGYCKRLIPDMGIRRI